MATSRVDIKVILLAAAVAGVAGGLGAYTSRAPSPPAATPAPAAPAAAGAAPTGEPVERAPPALAAVPAPSLELLTRCGEQPAPAAVRVRRLDDGPTTSRWSPAWQGQTAADGRARLPLGPGLYAAAANAPCGRARQSFTVRAGQAQQQVELALSQGRAVSGRVTEAASGNPVPGALVTSRALLSVSPGREEPEQEEEALTATADSFGRFQLDGVGERVHLTATANGFGEGELELEPDDAREVTLPLERACTLTGTVTGGEAVVSLTVRSGHAESSALANPDGRFRIEVAPGDVQVVARSGAKVALTRFPLGRDCARAPLELVLAPGASVTGRAVEEGTQTPVPCARVWARTEADPYELAAAQAGADGSFRLEGLPLGPYWVLASCPSGERGDVLHVQPGAQVEIAMRAAAALAGRVVDGEGQPVSGARVRAVPTGAAGFEAVTDAEGRFLLQPLPAVSLRVEARAGAAVSDDEEVQLTPGATGQVELKVEPVAVVRGHVSGPVPKKMWIVASRKGSPGGNRAEVDKAGNYRMEVSPGTYLVFGMVPEKDTGLRHQVVTASADHETVADFDLTQAAAQETFSSVAPGEIGVAFERGPGGLAISWVATDGPAFAAGVREGDLLLAIDGQPLDDTLEAYQRARGAPGSKLSLEVRHAGKDETLALTRQGATDPFR